MPIYGYHCDSCGNEFEILQSMKDEPLRVCDKCGGPLRKLLYPVGISFKGSGFYTTDYKGGAKTSVESGSSGGDGPAGESKPAAAEAKPSGGEAKASDSKSESKSETKSESKSEAAKPAAKSGD